MSHHVDSKHFAILKLYQKQCSNATTKFDVHQIVKKKKKPIVASIVDFFNSGVPWKKKNLIQEQLLEDLVLYITKGYCPLNSIESI
jgi:hypothetical protein